MNFQYELFVVYYDTLMVSASLLDVIVLEVFFIYLLVSER